MLVSSPCSEHALPYYKSITHLSQCNKATIRQVTTMLATSKNVLFPSHSHLLTTSTGDPSLPGTQAIIKVSRHQYLWLAGGYNLEIGHF